MFRQSICLCVVLLLTTAALAITGNEQASPESVDGATTIDTAKAKWLFDRGALFIDVRNDADWETGRIPGATHVELEHMFTEERLSTIAQKSQEVVMYCNGPRCLRSSTAVAKAVAWGFTRVYYYRAGFPAWQLSDYPVE